MNNAIKMMLVHLTLFTLMVAPSAGGLTQHRASVTTAVTSPTVMTECGLVKGSLEQGVNVFKGIPYAEPPVNQNRWKAPAPLSNVTGTCWSGTYDATTFGAQCAQPINSTDFIHWVGKEDCLYFNVWSPSLDVSDNLPVMAWVHGGDLVYGNGSMPGYSPSPELAKDLQFVFVSMNYRLGPLGFMTLDLLSKASDTGTSGNYGFMDQIQVLKWIQSNIRNFGGDPNKVTLFGQSSGGTSIYALLASPLAVGLFHRAWVMSASAVLNKTSSDASSDNQVFQTASGCADIQCLQSLSVEKIFKASPWTVYPNWAMSDISDLPVKGGFDGALAVVDGHVIPHSPMDAWQQGQGTDVPVIFSTMAQEADKYHLNMTTWDEYRSEVTRQLSSFGSDIPNKLLQLYPESQYITPKLQLSDLISDLRVTCPIDVVADVADSYFKSLTYRCVVTQWPSQPVPGHGRYSYHGWDSTAFFGTIDKLIPKPSQSDLDFTANLRREISAFVKTGEPASTTWKPTKISTALLGSTTNVTKFYHRDQCTFLLRNGFFSYAWIN
ncbi:para-nitrobenzyl esterase-like [Haliotis rufescens]|uniref:para-nitrobenzyl esterase-like n=1 Tax=Haliotis rufescens TaxID=6454 RepID=UPI001EB01F7F|nr:para-nitrobenzyl esterase-like [Haliotis rufescens]